MMPIYEYRCKKCAGVTGVLVLRPAEESEVRCSSCGHGRLVRVLSRFAVHRTETDRLKALDTSAPRDESFYRDSRNVGLWAKKRAEQLGAELGPDFDEVVERARTGKFLRDHES